MQRTQTLLFAASRSPRFYNSHTLYSKPIIQINNGTFYRQHPSSKSGTGQNSSPNPPVFSGLSFSLPSASSPNEHWAILSPSSTLRTAFLQILVGQYICLPPTARSYPYLISDERMSERENSGKRGSRSPEVAIQYVGFDVERRAMGGQYLSARYESRVESTDFTLGQYLTGILGMNPGEEIIKERTPDQQVMKQVVEDLELERFFEKPVSTLSNGQSRRARIGKALLTRPEVLCLDAPFIGLDPFVSKHISQLLHRLAEARAPRIVLSLRPQDAIPDWITHLVHATEKPLEGTLGGLKDDVLHKIASAAFERPPQHRVVKNPEEKWSHSKSLVSMSRDGYKEFDEPLEENKIPMEPLVEMEGVRIKYGPSAVLGDWQQDVDGTQKNGLWWTVRRGERWGIFGANGSGKTTLLSLVTSDHPQTYSAPVKLFQRSRLPKRGVPGITIFDIQARMGHSSPEVHALFPRNLSVRQTLETAWSDTPITKPKMDTDAVKRVDACLRWFEAELNPPVAHLNKVKKKKTLAWADHSLFGGLTFSAQRVLLFLRATISNPEIVILDEAFSGMDDIVRDKCIVFLSRGESMRMDNQGCVVSDIAERGEVLVPGLQEHQALLCVSHSEQEVPGCVREWVCLPESGTGAPKFGRWDGPLETRRSRWNEIWDWPLE